MTTRRQFIRATAGIVAAVVASPITVALDARPQFWGDGLHDDWPALDFMARESARLGRPLFLRGATIAISRGLGHVPGQFVTLEDMEIKALPNFEGGPMVHLAEGATMRNCTLFGLSGGIVKAIDLGFRL